MKTRIGRLHIPPIITGIVLILLPLIVWLTYARGAGWPLIEPDSQGYIEQATGYFNNPFVRAFFSQYRTPGYPLALLGALLLSGVRHLPVTANQLARALSLTVIAQVIFHLLTLLLLYYTLVKTGVSRLAGVLFTLFIGLDILVFSFDTAVLTESFASAWLIVMTYISFLLLKKPASLIFILFFLGSVAGFLIRPLYAAFPFCVLPVVALYRRSAHTSVLVIASLALWVLVPYTYMSMNTRLWGYVGINHTSEIDVLGRILHHNLPVESARDILYFYERVTAYRKMGGDVTMPYKFLNYYDPTGYGNVQVYNDLVMFTRRIVFAAPVPFFASIAEDAPIAFTNTDFTDITRVRNIPPSPAGTFFSALFAFYADIKWITYVFIPLLPYIFVKMLRSGRNIWFAFLTCLGGITLYQFAVSLILGYAEFDRLTVPVQPQLYFFCFGALYELGRSLVHAVQRHRPAGVRGG